MKQIFLSLLFCCLSCVTSSSVAAEKVGDTRNPPESASVEDLNKTSIPSGRKVGLTRTRIAGLDNPTLRANIEPPRHIELIQNKLADQYFTIEKRWFFEFPRTPMRSTGYWVNQGDTLEVRLQFTGAPPSPMPAVWIHTLDDRTWNYSAAQKVRLRQGTTPVVASKKGAVYIAVENQPTGGTMSVDILSGGHPMPRFILGGHALADWSRMLSEYGNAPYAELIGHRAMMTLTLARARQYVDDPVEMLAQWDKVINFAEALYGLSLDNQEPHDSPQFPYHFVECHDCHGDYMFAWYYRMGFYNDEIRKVVNRRLMEADGWGPWHELGHLIQHDDLTADNKNDDETVVNISTLWIQTEFFGQKSELESEDVWPKIQRYLAKNSRNWDNLDDVWIRLGMYWQLRLAFGPTFYPRYARESRQLKGYPGGAKVEKQARVVIETSRVAGRT